ncbi:MAG: hypothetical protein WCP60_10630 [bacterium]
MKLTKFLIIILSVVAAVAQEPAPTPVWQPGKPPAIATGTGHLVQCPEPLPAKNFRVDQQAEKFFIFVPKGYRPDDKNTKYGLIVFISAKPDDETGVPSGWIDILNKRNLFFIAPQGVDNHIHDERRKGMALLSVDMMLKYYPSIEPSRIYSAGISGGARVAGQLGFSFPQVFRGTVQSCGCDFYEPVPHVAVTAEDLKKNEGRDKGIPYGLWPVASPQLARGRVKFVFVTGPKDFRHDYILDLYNGGFLKNGFRAKLLDVPTMGHQICSGDSLEQALGFIEGQ